MMKMLRELAPWVAAFCLILAFWVVSTTPAFAQIPDAARGFQREYTRIVRSEMGLEAPVATLAAQIHQESTWNCRAVSPVGARGCAQFMPATERWIGSVSRLGEGDAFTPAWAFRAQAHYIAWLQRRVKGSGSCDQMAAVLASYNAGLGWILRAQKQAGTVTWLNGAERANPGQAAWAFKESREYPRRILGVLESRYVKAGWGLGACA